MEDHYLLLYDYVEGMAERRAPYREAHLAHARATPSVIMAGGLGDPVTGGALVFRGATLAEVEAFADADPYLTAGLITGRRIEPWKLV